MSAGLRYAHSRYLVRLSSREAGLSRGGKIRDVEESIEVDVMKRL